ncbi:MAG: protein phosphatase 2C domain-containing protein [Verrucomicrobiota bacterium]
MKIEEDYSGREDIGSRRYQEDYYAFSKISDSQNGEHGLLVVLADGMGGHQSGEVASQTSVESFIGRFHRCEGSMVERLSKSLLASNDAIRETIEQSPNFSGMGTTLVAGTVLNREFHFISIGDSLLYRFTEDDLKLLNTPHSTAAVLASKIGGDLSAEELSKHPYRNALRAALMGTPIQMADFSPEPIPLKSGDVLIFASDGINSLSQYGIRMAIAKGKAKGAGAIADCLIDAVLEEDVTKQDNVTIAATVIG